MDHQGPADDSENIAAFLTVLFPTASTRSPLSAKQRQVIGEIFLNWFRQRPTGQQQAEPNRQTSHWYGVLKFSISPGLDSPQEENDHYRESLLYLKRQRENIARQRERILREHERMVREHENITRELAYRHETVARRLEKAARELRELADERRRISDGFIQDQQALAGDQMEIRDDFRVAILTILANQRPDLLARTAEQLIRSEAGTGRESRAHVLITTALRDAIKSYLKSEKNPGSPSAKDT
jgi:hypothetical protein